MDIQKTEDSLTFNFEVTEDVDTKQLADELTTVLHGHGITSGTVTVA